MKKNLSTIIFFILQIFLLAGCINKDELSTPPGGTGNNGQGKAMFWIASDLGCGVITVTCNGMSKQINSYYSGGVPSCGASGTATFDLGPGTYNYTASCSGLSGSGTITVASGNCSTMQLTNGGGGLGGTATTGQAMFWIASDLGCGSINVTCNGQTRTISSFYSGGAPSCGAAGTATFTFSPGTYNYTASCTGKTWSGSAVISSGGCNKIQLTSSGGGGGGGGGGSCNWQSATNCVQVTRKIGTRCGDPQSVEITAKNICNQNIKVYICIQKSDGTWSGGPDGTFSTGLAPGASTIQYVCKGTGVYKIGAMPITTFNNNNCPWPSCN